MLKLLNLVLSLTFLLSSCATFDYTWVKTREAMSRPWFYLYTNDVNLTCHSWGIPKDVEVLACASRTRDPCMIILPVDAPLWLIEHEEKHCYGWSHQ